MKRLSIRIPPEQHKVLLEIARMQNDTQSGVMRRALMFFASFVVEGKIK